jgi:hypothetical protein
VTGMGVEMDDVTAVRAGFGLAQLAGPWPTSERSGGQRLTQLLGVRNLVQAGLSGPRPTVPVLALGVEVDLLHALTMVAVALTRRSARGAALAQATVALGFAVAGAVAAQRAAQAPIVVHQGRFNLLRVRDEWAQSAAHHLVPRRLTGA